MLCIIQFFFVTKYIHCDYEEILLSAMKKQILCMLYFIFFSFLIFDVRAKLCGCQHRTQNISSNLMFWGKAASWKGRGIPLMNYYIERMLTNRWVGLFGNISNVGLLRSYRSLEYSFGSECFPRQLYVSSLALLHL